MSSWWQLGEGSGLLGEDLALYKIECPFCNERGNFERAFHAEKKKPGARKVLNFDVYKCANCAGYVHVLWSASEFGGSQGLHQFRVLPWPIGRPTAPEHWPDEIRRSWEQAHDSLNHENWDAAAVMARSALQAAFRRQGAKGRTLNDETASLAAQGILPPIMKEWSTELRLLANDSAHPDQDQEATNPQDARDVVEFLDYLLEYLYNLPKSIGDYRKRREKAEGDTYE